MEIKVMNELYTVGKILFGNSRPLEYDEAILLDKILCVELKEKNKKWKVKKKQNLK